MFKPDWKIKEAYNFIKGDISNPTNPNISILTNLLLKSSPNKEAQLEFNKAFIIYNEDIFVKEVLEAMIICDDFSKVEASLLSGIPEITIETYLMFFFDLDIFEYKLHKYEYVRTYNNPVYTEGKAFKIWAVSVGMDFFRWKFNSVNYEALPKKMMLSIMGDVFFRAKEHLEEDITSPRAREALRYIDKLPVLASGIKNIDIKKEDSFLDEFKIVLTTEDTTLDRDTLEGEIIE